MKTTLLEQIRQRRKALGVKIQEMPLLAGLTRQQYGKIEAGGNPRLNSLDQIAEGLDAVLVLVPKAKLNAVERVLAGESSEGVDQPDTRQSGTRKRLNLDIDTPDENPWGEI